MTSRTGEALLWAQRVMGRKGVQPHELLEVQPNATAEQAQEAFHKIARNVHPDLHRQVMTADELELLTSAYAKVAGAYQMLRTQTVRVPIVKEVGPQTPATPAGPLPATSSGQQMNAKAVGYFRKAELCLRRGDLKSAVLQLKLACAADPTSGFLRTALAEVEAEARKL